MLLLLLSDLRVWYAGRKSHLTFRDIAEKQRDFSQCAILVSTYSSPSPIRTPEVLKLWGP